MAPSRFQCLNSAREVSKNLPRLRVGFCTTQNIRAEDESRRSPTSDLLGDILNPVTPSKAAFPKLSNPQGTGRYQNSALPRTLYNPRTPGKRATSGNSGATSAVLGLIQKVQNRDAQQKALSRDQSSAGANASTPLIPGMRENELQAGLARQMLRRWKEGDVYAPHDLSEVEAQKWRHRRRPAYDVFDVLDMNPLDYYRNFSIMSEYTTPGGRIKHSKDTGLRPVNQRRIAKAIRRAIGIGLMPSVHAHPEILQKKLSEQWYQQNNIGGRGFL